MSRTIDERVVQMTFNNKQFETGVKDSLNTLQRLKDATSSKAVGGGLESLSRAARGVDLSPIASGIDAIQKRFSTLGIVGMTVIQDLTHKAVQLGSSLVNAVSAPIMQGGFNRAMKIENAKFTLEGLLKDAELVEKIMGEDGPVRAAVSGTAYGVDAAASVASQLVASGVKDLDVLEGRLKAVAGVAAMTNSSYEEIGQIFTTIAGNGRMYAMQLQQLSSRGLNAAAILAEQLGTTEEAVRKMVSNGEISFDIFANAMEEAFGDQAKKADETFEGSMANIRAALSRTGAAFYAPLIERNSPLIKFFNTVRDKIDEMNGSDGMKSIVAWFTEDLTAAIQWAQKIVDGFDIQGLLAAFANLFAAAESIAKIFNNRVLEPFRFAFAIASEFSGLTFPTMDRFVDFTRKINEFFTSHEDDTHHFWFSSVIRGVIATVRIAVRVFKDFWEITAPLRSALYGVYEVVFEVFASLGVAIESLFGDLQQMGNVFQWLAPGINVLSGLINGLVEKFFDWAQDTLDRRIYDGFYAIGSAIQNIIPKIVDFIKAIGRFVNPSRVFHTAVFGVKTAIDKLTPHLQRGKEAILSFFRSLSGETVEMDAVEKFQHRVRLFQKVLEKLLNVLKAVGGVIKSVLTPLGVAIKRFVGDITIKDITSLGWTGVALMLASSFKKISDQVTNMWKLFNKNVGNGGIVGLLFGGDAAILPAKFNTVLTNIGNTLIRFNASIKTALDIKMIETVAKAIGIIAASITVLSFIPTDRLMNACVALAVAMGILVAGIKLLQESMFLISSSDLKTGPLVAMLMALSISLGIVSSAVYKMSKAAAKGTLVDGVIGMIFAMVALVVAIKTLSNIAVDMNLAGFGLILVMAIAISSISKSIVRLAKIEDGLTGAMGVIAMLGLLIGGIIALAGLIETNVTSSGAGPFIGIAVMILAITSMFKQIAKMSQLDLSGIAVAVGAMIVVMASIAGFIALLGLIFRGGGGFGGGDTAILLGVSASMILMAVSIRILASALKTLSDIKPEDLGNAVVALVVVLAALAVACYALSHAALGAVAITIMTIALAALVPIILTIGATIGPFILGIVGLAAALTVLTIAAIAIAPWLLFLLAAAGGILAIGIAVGVLGAGLIILNVAIGTFIGSAAAFITMIDLLIRTIADLLPYVVQRVVDAIVVFFTSIADATPQILGSIANVIIGILQLLVDFIPAFAAVAVQLLVTILQTIVDYLPVIVDTLFQFVVGLVNGLADAIRNNGEALFDAIDNLLSAILEFLLQGISHIFGKIPIVGDKIQEWAEGAQSGVHKFFTGNELSKEVDSGVDSMVQAANAGESKMEDAGSGLGDSLMTGFKNKLGLSDGSNSILNDITGMFSGGTDEMQTIGVDLGGSLNTGMQSALGIGAEGEGSTIISDLTSSISNSAPEMNATGVEMGNELTSGFSDSVENFDMTNLTNSFNLDFLTGAQNATPSAKDTGGQIAEETMSGLNEKMIEVAAPGGEAFASEINRGFEEEMIEVAAPSGEGYGTEIMSGLNDKMVEVAAPGGSDFADEIDRGFDEETIEVAAPSGNAFGDEVISGVVERKPQANTAGAELADAGVQGASSKYDEWYSAGQNSGQGYVDGLLSEKEAARAAGSAIVTAANNATKQAAKIESPSKLFMSDGVMSGLGYAMGLADTQDDAASSGAGLVTSAKDAIMAGMNELSKLGDLSGLSATLTPVMDMSSTRASIAGLSNVELQNAKIGATSQLNAAINAQMMNDRLASELARQNEMMMVQNGIENQMLQQMKEMAGQTSILRNLLRATQEGGNVYLDGNTLVGSISARMDRQLGIRAARAARGS